MILLFCFGQLNSGIHCDGQIREDREINVSHLNVNFEAGI